MIAAPLVLGVSFGYLLLLFAVAAYGDRRAALGRGVTGNAWIYALSWAVYCSAWTYFGSVGRAASSGVWFLPIYLGPMLAMLLGWVVVRKMVRIGQVHRITSIADMISSRYGKSGSLAALITVIAVIAITPYIALQLKSVTISFQVISSSGVDALTGVPSAEPDLRVAFWVAAGMAFFTILFGTRNIDANERHHGVVAAIAL